MFMKHNQSVIAITSFMIKKETLPLFCERLLGKSFYKQHFELLLTL